MADCMPTPEKVKREWVVRGDFDPDAARVIANALSRDGMEAEADTWRKAANEAEAWNREDGR